MRSKYPILFVALFFVLSINITAQRPEPIKTMLRGDTLYTLLIPGAIPAIFEPEFVTVKEAAETYYDDEPLIVVSDGGESKGYSIWHLDQHEVVNDYINGKAITVTW